MQKQYYLTKMDGNLF